MSPFRAGVLKGRYPRGSRGSLNCQGAVLTWWNAESKTSTRPWAKLAANSRSPWLVEAIASPVYPAPGTVTLSSALPMRGSTMGLQASMWPSSVAKMNAAGALTVPLLRTNPVPVLFTWPVGPATEPAMVTRTVGTLVTVAELGGSVERGELSGPWLDTHRGEVGACEMPQGFFRSGSVRAAMPGISEARFTWFSLRSWPGA